MLLPLLHSSPPDEQWLAAWHLEPVVTIVLLTATVAYALAYKATRLAARPRPPLWQALSYYAGLGATAIALIGPPSHLNGQLFSAHMVQHLLLTLVAPPLLVLGRPVQLALRGVPPRYSRALLRPTLGRPWVRRVLTAAAHPIVVLVLFNGSLLIWHLPALYQAAVMSWLLHELEHACFFGTALLFWWVLVEPVPRGHRLGPVARILVLFSTWMISDLLGATLTLAPDLLYPVYAAVPSPWGLTPLADQRLGGLIMWVGGGGLFAALLIGFLAYPHVRRGDDRHTATSKLRVRARAGP
jgi:cytochrome c oxidase assembly factor CtaG